MGLSAAMRLSRKCSRIARRAGVALQSWDKNPMNLKFSRLSVALLLGLAATGAQAQNIPLTGAYTQDFDTLSNTAGSTTNSALPTGWLLNETGGGARDNEQYAVDTGGSGPARVPSGLRYCRYSISNFAATLIADSVVTSVSDDTFAR